MSKFVFSGLAAGLIGGAMLLSGTAPASAVTLPSAAVTAPAEAGVVEEVQRRGERRVRRGDDRRYSRRDGRRHYDRHRHGLRYSYRRPGFHHYYGGHYYSSPWWIGPSIGFGITVPGVALGLGGGYNGHSAHVQWCLNRYRTYDPATDTYIPRVGERAYCNSPYSLDNPGVRGVWAPDARLPRVVDRIVPRPYRMADPMPPHPAAFLVFTGDRR